MEALTREDIPGYLQNFVGSYFTDMEDGNKEYRGNGRVPQCSILSPYCGTLCNVNYSNWYIPRAVTPVALADDITLVIQATYRQAMELVRFKLADNKTQFTAVRETRSQNKTLV